MSDPKEDEVKRITKRIDTELKGTPIIVNGDKGRQESYPEKPGFWQKHVSEGVSGAYSTSGRDQANAIRRRREKLEGK